MKPVAIVQHEPEVGPGNFAEWLDAHGLPQQRIAVFAGEALPADPSLFAGLCFLGGSMSVNDPLPWIEPALALIRAADRHGVPVIGHCLGGQLLARALGATVTRQPVKEIGWADVEVTDEAVAVEWFGPDAPARLELFHWHEDAFELPDGARAFLRSAQCRYQAYVVERPRIRPRFAHLGMQFHCEMTPELVRSWALDPAWRRAAELRGAQDASVQSAEQMLADLDERTARMRGWAERLYRRWAEGLAR